MSVSPVARRESVVAGEKYRFTVLTSRLIRIEYNENGKFEDRATQVVINRAFSTPKFSASEYEGKLTITTDHIELSYITSQPFLPTSLKLRYIGDNANVKAGAISNAWRFRDDNAGNLYGTARTLDRVDGACDLESGIMSVGTVTVMDDSNSLIICEDGQINPRGEKSVDQYLFCYGDAKKRYNYKDCLRDFYKLTGNTPMLPRFALGNWWSRYHPYTQREYTDLMKRFKKEQIPFSVAVIDMDWHYVEIEPKYGSGWTGYTWNQDLFPNHKEFLEFLHKEGLVPSLNLHPQEGIAAHEAAYPRMAEAMGIDPQTEKTIPFEIENPNFIENYFKYLHHPLEEDGVRFWWIDWQQGNATSVPGLDPLWMLNHYHYLDNAKNGQRGLVFSRYAGPGSHRYPIGFSGDTIVTWESLDFQPYFTATASNIGYGWWSHDIGGHMDGYRNEELIARWVQLGTFSPINRLHSSRSEFQGKEPWKYNRIAEESMKRFLSLRHELIPYLYTMNYRASELGEPLVRPLYYECSEMEAYYFRNEYFFGTEMLVSPITTPCDSKTKMGSVKTYIPDGDWYDFFNGRKYRGGRTLTLFRNLNEMPILVKSGGIIPMAKLVNVNSIENPSDMKIKVFPGCSNTFELYEDDGNTYAYKQGKYATTRMKLIWNETPHFIIEKTEGDVSLVPQIRNFDIEFVGIEDAELIVLENGSPKTCIQKYANGSLMVSVEEVTGLLEIRFTTDVHFTATNVMDNLCTIIEHLENIDNSTKEDIYRIICRSKNAYSAVSNLLQLELDKSVLLSLCEIITAEHQ